MPPRLLLAGLVLLPLLSLGPLGFDSCATGLPPPAGRAVGALHLPALHAEPDPVQGGRIVDAAGREVLLRGVNVNAFVDYWAYDPSLFTAYPFTEQDADRIAGLGWNAVRLLLSWSRVEPEPGVYDDAYLDRIAGAVRVLEAHGVYTIIDLHQDAWGPSLAARPGEVCAPGTTPAFGWDGAPAWATLGGDQPRCAPGGIRELSPAVTASFDAFFADAPGAGGIGIRTRYVRMLAHVASRFARDDAVAGYDVMNEPNAFTSPTSLPSFYAAALGAIRGAEDAAGAPPRLVFFEPSALWATLGLTLLQKFTDDTQVVYAPHLYQGGIGGQLSAAPFEQARSEAATLFGGAPVVSGEWGSDPRRAADPSDDYFERHQALQDQYRIGATLWTWHEACGDPHKAADALAGQVPYVWGLFEVDCATNQVLGLREPLVQALRRGYVRAAPGRLDETAWDPVARTLSAQGRDALPGTALAIFWPSGSRRPPRVVDAHGLLGIHTVPTRAGDHYVLGAARGGAWSIELEEQP
jgi:endoglycosylceramidase